MKCHIVKDERLDITMCGLDAYQTYTVVYKENMNIATCKSCIKIAQKSLKI